jgi:DNA-binding transcriptional LysR family regulator
MDLHHLRHAIALADESHFGRAAARLGMAQAPLSQSIQRLERELGLVLFERSHKGTRLTAAGEAFVTDARVAVAAAERAANLARAVADQQAPVRIGLVSLALWGPLPSLLKTAQAAAIPVTLIESSTDDQLALVASGELDLAFVSPPFAAPARLQAREIAAEPLIAALPAASLRSDEADAVSLARLSHRLILFPSTQGPTLHQAILTLFRARGLQAQVVQEASRMPTILTLVAAGLGAALVPAGVARHMPVPGVAFRRLKDAREAPTWPLTLAHLPLPAKSPAANLLRRWRQQTAKPQRAHGTLTFGAHRGRLRS